MNLRAGETFVLTIIPLVKIGVKFRVRSVPGEFCRLPGAAQRACQHPLKHLLL
jgi:hypothetical protein